MVVKINIEKCKGCGSCVEACPQGVLKLKNKKCIIAKPKDCLECGTCVYSCPQNALSLG
jgi:NAD-dependent dihydropyrimidine dehydrogenase PreA subunit